MKAGVAAVTDKAPRPRGRPKLTSRLDEVLACAAAMFSARGYAAANLEDIAAQLGMTRAALYYYATSKEDLLYKCYDWNWRRFTGRLSVELHDGTGREMLIRFCQIYSECVCDDASRCFLSSEDHYLNPEQQKESAAQLHEINVLVGDILKKGVTDGTLAPHNPRYAMTTLFGALNALPRVVRPNGASPKEMGEGVLEIILQGLSPRGETPGVLAPSS